MIYVAVTLASIFGGYGLSVLLSDERPPAAANPEKAAPATVEEAKPWYLTQSPPPALPDAPDAPLFPELDDADKEAAPQRAYEEALPDEIYVQPAKAKKDPLKKQKTVSVPPSPPPPGYLDDPLLAPPKDVPLPPWRRYAVPMPDTGARPVIALVIDDMGVDQARSAQVAAFKGPMTLSYLTYAKDLAKQTAKARKTGHELLLHVSMEPASRAVDPGPNVLLVGMEPGEIRRRLAWGFSRFATYVGINNHMGSKFTADPFGMAVVMEELKKKGLLFLDSRTTPVTKGPELAMQLGVPLVQRNIFLDNINEVAAVNARLAELERLAKQKGYALAIGHPRDATIKALKAWLPTLEARGFSLVPVSAILHLEQKGG
jgi:uncharacterized protein